jgi:hypothetical protein
MKEEQSSVSFLLEWLESEQLPFLPLEITDKAREIERQLWQKAYDAGVEDGRVKENQAWEDVFVSKENLNNQL